MKYARQWCFCSAKIESRKKTFTTKQRRTRRRGEEPTASLPALFVFFVASWLPLFNCSVLLAALGVVLFASYPAQAQPRGDSRVGSTQQQPSTSTPPQAPNNTPNGEGMLTDTNKDYLIAPGDVVEVWIEDAPELSRNYRVNAAGEFPMEIIGRVAAKQKTTEELARYIATRLREEEFLVRPSVVVTMRQFNSQTFIVQGSVNRPGVYQLEGRPTLLTLIGLAGGLNDNHGSTAYVFRRKNQLRADDTNSAQSEKVAADKLNQVAADTSKVTTSPIGEQANQQPATAQAEDENNNEDVPDDYELIKVNLAALYKGHFEHNQALSPSDIINIPRADVFFVAGEVNMPGSYPLKEGTTLRQAISLAQGMTFKAKGGRGVIFRENPDTGKREEIAVDIGDVMNGKKEDLLITANDVIIVPNSRTKSISSALLTAFGVNAARIPVRY